MQSIVVEHMLIRAAVTGLVAYAALFCFERFTGRKSGALIAAVVGAAVTALVMWIIPA